MAVNATQIAVTTTPGSVLDAASTWVVERGHANSQRNLHIQNHSAVPVYLSGSSVSTGGGYMLTSAPTFGSKITLGVYGQALFAVTSAGATATISVIVG